MRERITLAFVVVTLLLLAGVGVLRSLAVREDLRDRDAEVAVAAARSLARAVDLAATRDRRTIARLVGPFATRGARVVYESPGLTPVVATGPAYDGSDDAVSATAVTSNGTVTVRRTEIASVGLLGTTPASTISLVVLAAILAGVLGYLVARGLSEPFRRLAEAASALARGRSDVTLPDSRVPEVRAIARALEGSATQLQERLARERDFALHASHTLRTPLTSVRLRLEDLVADPGLPDEARETAVACLAAVGRLGEATTELIEISRGGELVAGAATPLHELAVQVAQRWSDLLEARGHRLTAAIDGEGEVPVTPGPDEQVVDLALGSVLADPDDDVRLVFAGGDGGVRVDLSYVGEDGPRPLELPDDSAAHTAVAVLGGRLERPPDRQVLRVYLPRR